MTRWRTQGIGVVGWFVAALGVSCVLPDQHSLFLAPQGFLINFVFMCGPVAGGASLATTLLVLIWRTMTSQAVAWVHGALGIVCLVALMVSLGW